jgi:hypothetical protein
MTLAASFALFASHADANAVNDYIKGRSYTMPLPAQQIHWNWNHRTDEWKNSMDYRNGYNKPEGVLVHESGTESDKGNANAITSQISYMTTHHDNAFTHSWVSQSRIIEIADPVKLAWGAGPAGNKRFVQTESTRVNTKEAFANELWNMAVLQTDYLYRFNLGTPKLNSNLWSHHMVSVQLGGTDHVDPDGYWADSAAKFFGTTYTMNDYEWLLKYVYNQAHPKFSVGSVVKINGNAVSEANGTSITNRRNKLGTITSVYAHKHASSKFAYNITFKNGGSTTSNWYIPEQDVGTAPTAKYAVGANVQIAGNAVSETNGTSLVNHRNWIGTIKKVQADNHASSQYSYYVEFNNGTRKVSNWYIPEQDLRAVTTTAAYKVGQVMQIKPNANVETNGSNLQNHRGWIGTIKKVQVDNAWSSRYSYYVEYKTGAQTVSNWYVTEQDLMAPKAGLFAVGQSVKVKSNAQVETNGTSIVNRHGLTGVVKKLQPDNKFGSNYSYYVEFVVDNKTVSNWFITEQDLMLP